MSEQDAAGQPVDVDEETVFATRRIRRARTAKPAEREIAMLSMPQGEISTREGVGDVYRPRAVPLSPVAPPSVAQAAAPTRLPDAELVSVQRQTRRLIVAVLAGCVVAVAVSLVGLVSLGIVVLS
ncbi:MAG: hypothetical protein ACTH8F_00050 [Microbacterium sp.]|uniref:hypothetical protein n=1 Tax=Microbacterium sp. TaxID=51671 RepID=UPI003F9B385F